MLIWFPLDLYYRFSQDLVLTIFQGVTGCVGLFNIRDLGWNKDNINWHSDQVAPGKSVLMYLKNLCLLRNQRKILHFRMKVETFIWCYSLYFILTRLTPGSVTFSPHFEPKKSSWSLNVRNQLPLHPSVYLRLLRNRFVLQCP